MHPLRFASFTLDPANRRLTSDGTPVELNSRYLDALALLVREPGQLVVKERFMDEVWRGVPVTDEALTQCIRSLRKALGDDAANPRFIETVPKHGYRFIAAVDAGEGEASQPSTSPRAPTLQWPERTLLSGAGIVGGGVAGAIGGILYGFHGASQSGSSGASALIVLLCITVLVGMIGAAGVAAGIALAGFGVKRPTAWIVAGGAGGGLAIGAVAKLLGLDAFTLLLGQSPGNVTGAPEGFALGAAAGLGAWLGTRGTLGLRKSAALAALFGALTGAGIVLAGGRLLMGSLDLLARQFPASRLRLDPLGALTGEAGFGPLAHAITAAGEGALFTGCVVAAMLLARRQLGER